MVIIKNAKNTGNCIILSGKVIDRTWISSFNSIRDNVLLHSMSTNNKPGIWTIKLTFNSNVSLKINYAKLQINYILELDVYHLKVLSLDCTN